jgi:hypothetical protein
VAECKPRTSVRIKLIRSVLHSRVLRNYALRRGLTLREKESTLLKPVEPRAIYDPFSISRKKQREAGAPYVKVRAASPSTGCELPAAMLSPRAPVH